MAMNGDERAPRDKYRDSTSEDGRVRTLHSQRARTVRERGGRVQRFSPDANARGVPRPRAVTLADRNAGSDRNKRVPPLPRMRKNLLLADPADGSLPTVVELTEAQKKRRDSVIRALIAILAATAVLVALGVIMVFSATSARSIGAVAIDGGGEQIFSIALRHSLWVFISVLVAVLVSFLPYQWVERCSYWLLALGVVLQLGVLAFGVTINGNTNWLALGPVQVQPSEFLKAAMVVWLAHVLARLQLEEVRTPITLVVPALGFILATSVVLMGRDMGTALIYVLIGGGMVWLAGMRNRYLVAVAAFGVFGAAILVAAQPYRLRRVEDFFSNFFAMPDIVEPTQAEFAQFAFGSGGIAGVGLGAGKEKWGDLAEAHTDFIFAVIGEELGLFGTLTVVALFLLLGWGFIHLAQNINTRYGQLVTTGAALWICGQAILNMCVVTGVLPVFGVPLPFLSQGGSSMLGVLIVEGVVISCARSVPGVREALSIKSRFVRKARAVVRS